MNTEEFKKQEWSFIPKIPISNNPLFSFPLVFKNIAKCKNIGRIYKTHSDSSGHFAKYRKIVAKT